MINESNLGIVFIQIEYLDKVIEKVIFSQGIEYFNEGNVIDIESLESRSILGHPKVHRLAIL